MENRTAIKNKDIALKDGEHRATTELRTTTEEEKFFKEIMLTTASALDDSIRMVGKMYIIKSAADLAFKLGLDATATLDRLLLEANKKEMLFQKDNGFLTSLGLNLVAVYLNKLPLVDNNDDTFLCVCGARHKIRKTNRGKSVKCPVFMPFSIYAQSWTRLSIIFYSLVLRRMLSVYNIIPHVVSVN